MADMKPQGTQDYSVESGYESADANARSVVVGTVIVACSVFVVMAAMFAMFNVLNQRIENEDKKVPAAFAARIIPPEPRLLPSPYTDELPEARAVEKMAGRNPQRATSDSLPWDKRTSEIIQQYDETNVLATAADGRLQIPIEKAMELEAGVSRGGTPAAMTWQKEYPRFMAGETKGQMNLKAGQKEVVEQTFDKRPYWETQDEKFVTDSSGGTLLDSRALSR